MTKEIIVNAGEQESRVAILENGRLMELHIERDPKIVGNIYKGRVTKVLKGMDAAFVDIGIERNAFLSVSDVIPQEEETGGNGRLDRRNLPPITQLLHANQQILVQVARAPMGTKGARVTTRLSIPGRYLVLMLNSGTYVGVSRKVEDPRERQRLRAIGSAIRPENYSLIIRTEAEGRTEEELQQDLLFLVDVAGRIERKAEQSSAPALVHGDMSLIFRLIRDAFTRDISRLVLDSPDAYENALELIGMLAPRMKNRVFLYDEPMPIFHAYNIEPEIERMLRRKVWLPSGGHLVIDQAEALTAIDVNTGRFVGSTELAETVFTTNLQAAEEVARQLRLRDLGGIIVVDFIDMDNVRHRQQVMKTFEEALHRDRAKIKVHNISPLGLVEMTRKRTGESLSSLITEPCPYCSGIGRVQNSLSMALRIEREIAATAVSAPQTECYLVIAHPRVVASMLGYEGEAQHDLEQYIERAVYMRCAEEYHSNAYRIEHLTLEQALHAVKHFEEGQIVEGRVANPDPELSMSPMVLADGIYLIVPDLDAPVGALVKVRVTEVGTSLAFAEPVAEEQRGIRTEAPALPLQRPALIETEALPLYLRDERLTVPPRALSLLSPTAEAVPIPVSEEEITPPVPAETARERRRKKKPQRKDEQELLPVGEILPEVEPEWETAEEGVPPIPTGITDPFAREPETETEAGEAMPEQVAGSSSRRRRRRHRSRRTGQAVEGAPGQQAELTAADIPYEAPGDGELPLEAVAETMTVEETIGVPVGEEAGEPVPAAEEAAVEHKLSRSSRRRKQRNARRRAEEAAQHATEPVIALDGIELVPSTADVLSSEDAAETMRSLLQAIPPPEGTEEAAPATEEAVPVVVETPEAPPAATTRRPRTRRRRKTEVEETPALPVETAIVESPAEPVIESAPPAPAEAPPEAAPAEAPAETPKKTTRRRATGTTPRRRTKKTAESEPPAEGTEPPAEGTEPPAE